MTYAEPELVTGLQGYSGGPLIGGGGPVGPGVIGMSGPMMPNSRYMGGMGPPSGGSHYSSSLLGGGANKFNTIHSSVNKRNNAGGGGPGSGAFMALNHYESAGPPGLGGSRLTDSGGNGSASYHLSTLGRSSSVRGARDPLMPSSGSSSAGSGSGSGLKHPQAAKVVDSAYGTTRSSKKVYL